jgi:hypothetical protein
MRVLLPLEREDRLLLPSPFGRRAGDEGMRVELIFLFSVCASGIQRQNTKSGRLRP